MTRTWVCRGVSYVCTYRSSYRSLVRLAGSFSSIGRQIGRLKRGVPRDAAIMYMSSQPSELEQENLLQVRIRSGLFGRYAGKDTVGEDGAIG